MSAVVKKVQENKEVNTTVKKTVRKTATSKKAPSKSVASIPNITAVVVSDAYGKIFNLGFNPDLVAQYVRVYQSNQRKGNAQTKTRGDVAGSGKKPWKQKGTGRSRVGSIRTPVWRHGGVSHGPVVKDWSLNLSKKAKSKAFNIILSQKIASSQVFFLNEIDLKEGRTKDVLSLTHSWGLTGSALIVTKDKNANLQRGTSNLKSIVAVDCSKLNAYQLISHTNIIFEKAALDAIKERYAKN